MGWRDAPLAEWSVEDVAEWTTQRLEVPASSGEEYAQAFRANGVDGPLLALLTEAELEADIGVSATLHRRKIAAEVAFLAGGGDYRGEASSGGDDSPGSSISSAPASSEEELAPPLAASDDPDAWLCCETDAGQVYYHNTRTNAATFSAAGVPPSILPPDARPAEAALGWDDGAASRLILVSSRRFARLSPAMAAARRPVPPSELPPAPGQLRDGEVPGWALAPPLALPRPAAGAERAPIKTIQPPFEALAPRAQPVYVEPPATKFVPRKKTNVARHGAVGDAAAIAAMLKVGSTAQAYEEIEKSVQPSIFASPLLVEERYLNALKPVLTSHLQAVAGPCPPDATAEQLMRWCQGRPVGAAGEGDEAAELEAGGAVNVLDELYDNLAPALRAAPWLTAVAPGADEDDGPEGGDEAPGGVPYTLRAGLVSALESSRASHGSIGGDRLGQSPKEVAAGFVEEFESVAAQLLSGAERAQIAKKRRRRHGAAVELQRCARGWCARQPTQPWAPEYRAQRRAAVTIQKLWRGRSVWFFWERGDTRRQMIEAKVCHHFELCLGISVSVTDFFGCCFVQEDRENQKLQDKADRYNTGWMAHFEAMQTKYGDRQTYKVYLLKKELQKHGLEDDGNAETLVNRLAEFEADEHMAQASAKWDADEDREVRKKRATVNARVDLKLKKLKQNAAEAEQRRLDEQQQEEQQLKQQLAR